MNTTSHPPHKKDLPFSKYRQRGRNRTEIQEKERKGQVERSKERTKEGSRREIEQRAKREIERGGGAGYAYSALEGGRGCESARAR